MRRLPSEEDVVAFVVTYLSDRVHVAQGVPAFDEDFDFVSTGVLDSMGIVQMIAELEEHFGVTVDFQDIEPEDFGVIGRFSRYVARKVSSGPDTGST